MLPPGCTELARCHPSIHMMDLAMQQRPGPLLQDTHGGRPIPGTSSIEATLGEGVAPCGPLSSFSWPSFGCCPLPRPPLVTGILERPMQGFEGCIGPWSNSPGLAPQTAPSAAGSRESSGLPAQHPELHLSRELGSGYIRQSWLSCLMSHRAGLSGSRALPLSESIATPQEWGTGFRGCH